MERLFIDLSIVMIGFALLSWVTAKVHQPIIVGYILCGIIFGPWGLKWVSNVEFVDGISRLGITLLLFLARVVLHPQAFYRLVPQTTTATFLGCAFFFHNGLSFFPGVKIRL